MSNVSNEDFRAAVALLRECLENGCLRLRFPGVADSPLLEIVHKPLFEDAAEAFGRPDVLREVRRELPDMLRAILTGTGVPYISMKLRSFPLADIPAADEAPSQEETAAEKEQWRERLAVVQNELVTARVRQRFALRRTASRTLLRQCAGEITRQIYHTPAQGEAGLYVTLDLWMEVPEMEEGVRAIFFSTLGIPFSRPPERQQVALTCDETDLEMLIDMLTNLRDRLKEQLKTGAAENESIGNR